MKENENIKKLIDEKLELVWNTEIIEKNILAKPNQTNPNGYILGGQPGAGKSGLLEIIKKDLNKNVIIINGDDFRKYHPNYEEFQKLYGQDSPKYTANFAGAMSEAILNKAIKERYNIAIEGTFRTIDTPKKTAELFKNNGYDVGIKIQTCNPKFSWKSCVERYEKMLETNPNEARYTDQAHHNLVVKNLSKNIKDFIDLNITNDVEIYLRDDKFNNEKIFDLKNEEFKKETLDNILNFDNQSEDKLKDFKIKFISLPKELQSSDFEINKEYVGDDAKFLLQRLSVADKFFQDKNFNNLEFGKEDIKMNLTFNDKNYDLNLKFGNGTFARNSVEELIKIGDHSIDKIMPTENEKKAINEILSKDKNGKFNNNYFHHHQKTMDEKLFDVALTGCVKIAKGLDKDVDIFIHQYLHAFNFIDNINFKKESNEAYKFITEKLKPVDDFMLKDVKEIKNVFKKKKDKISNKEIQREL